jgi:hypothetical protein
MALQVSARRCNSSLLWVMGRRSERLRMPMDRAAAVMLSARRLIQYPPAIAINNSTGAETISAFEKRWNSSWVPKSG